jgi:hypothetical protein
MGTVIDTDSWDDELATIEELDIPVVPWTLAELDDVDDLASLRSEVHVND